MERPTRTSKSRLSTVAWAAAVFALLVLPPALSTGQESGAPATDPPAADPAPADPPSDPPQGDQQGQGGQGGSGAADGGQAPAPTPEPTASPAGGDVAVASASKSNAKAAGSLTVSIGDNFYSPASVSVDVGDTVTWSNNGAAQHSATASDGSFDTGVFGPGGSRSHTFSQAGTFNYFCTVHGTAQSGTVTVASTGGGGGGDQSEAAATASSDAAGSSSALPSTGSNTLPPMVVGLLLLFAGLALRFRDWFGPA